jgi:hypothetical protein
LGVGGKDEVFGMSDALVEREQRGLVNVMVREDEVEGHLNHLQYGLFNLQRARERRQLMHIRGRQDRDSRVFIIGGGVDQQGIWLEVGV